MKRRDAKMVQKALASAMAKLRTPNLRKSFGDNDVRVTKNPYCSISKYLRGVYTGNWEKAAEEQRIFKALNENIGTEGGVLVPPEISTEIIELLKDQATVRAMPGVRLIPMARDTWSQRRIDTGPTVSWGSENTAITEDTALKFGKVELELKKLVCLYKASRELIHDADVSVDAIVKQEIAEAIGLAEDLAFLEGTGGDQPTGFYNHTRVLNTDLSASITFDDILSAEYQVESNKSVIDGWIANPRTKNTLRTLKDADGKYLYADGKVTDVGNKNMGTLYGNVIRYTNQIPTTLRPSASESYMIGGRWSDLFIGDSTEGLRVETTDTGGDAFINDQLWIKVVKRTDMALRHPESFVRVKGIQS